MRPRPQGHPPRRGRRGARRPLPNRVAPYPRNPPRSDHRPGRDPRHPRRARADRARFPRAHRSPVGCRVAPGVPGRRSPPRPRQARPARRGAAPMTTAPGPDTRPDAVDHLNRAQAAADLQAIREQWGDLLAAINRPPAAEWPPRYDANMRDHDEPDDAPAVGRLPLTLREHPAPLNLTALDA